MQIDMHKKMMLFRYSNYRRTDFIAEHKKVISQNGYAWMLKAGKKSSTEKIDRVLTDGGYLILKSPVKEGNNYYVAIFDSFMENTPDDKNGYPEYYNNFMDDMYDALAYQWFRIRNIYRMEAVEADKIVLQTNNKKISEVLETTRTAVMFVQSIDIIGLENL